MNFIKIRGVEYSTDVNFFIREQLLITESKTEQIKFVSRLECFVFDTLPINCKYDAIELLSKAKTIHKKLIEDNS